MNDLGRLPHFFESVLGRKQSKMLENFYGKESFLRRNCLSPLRRTQR